MCGGDGDARLFSHSAHCCILLQSTLSCIYKPKALVVTESYLFMYVSNYLSTVQLFSFARN
jgi:hypothetical protein